jgi:hypothetical protein
MELEGEKLWQPTHAQIQCACEGTRATCVGYDSSGNSGSSGMKSAGLFDFKKMTKMVR